jgi:hypothetical protein
MKIEKNVPIPKALGGKAARWDAVDQLEIGDCILVETEAEADNVRYAMRYRKMKGTRRKMRDGYRIWRLE